MLNTINREASHNSTSLPVCFLYCEASFRTGMYSSAIAAIVFNTLIALTTVLGNGLLLLVYYKNQTIRRPANSILLGLAVTDFLTGAVSQPLFIYENLAMLFNCTSPLLCLASRLKNFFVIILLEATVVHLSLASVDRYVAVFYSLRYPDLVTNSRVVKAMLASWAVVLGLTLSAVLNQRAFVSAVIIFPPNILFIGILYLRIFKEIRRLEANPVVSANEAEEQRKARERKSTRTVATVLGLLFLCYIPMVLYLTSFLVQRFVLMKDDPVAKQQGLYVAMTFAALNSSLNVFVYYWRNSEIRSAILKVLEPISQRFVHSVNPA